MSGETSSTDRIDRIAPTYRPAGWPVMRHRWADLLFLHWIVPAAPLRALLPPGLELDTFEGNAYVGLVPFTMTGVRPTVLPSFPPLSNFHETNVRTYVHRARRDPGVWFFSLDAANAVAVRLGRAWFKLPYHFARMQLTKTLASDPADSRGTGSDQTGAEGPGNRWTGSGRTASPAEQSAFPTVSYGTERRWPGPLPGLCQVRYTPVGAATPAAAGTLEQFLVERYILYTYHNGRLYSGRVHHSPYPLQGAVVQALEENLVAAAGIAHPDTDPLAHYAREVRVHIYPLRRA